MSFAFCFNNEYTALEYYHNSSFLEYGGSPDKAVRNAFVYAIDQYLKQNSKYTKNEGKIQFSDIEDSLILVSNSLSTMTSYENQTKKAITNKFIQDSMTEFLREQLGIYFIENKLDAEKICEQVLVNKRSRETAEKTRINVKKKLGGSRDVANRVKKFVDCRSKDVTRREVYIVEGDSAGGSAIQGRNPITQAILPLRCKILNTERASLDRMMKSETIESLITAVGGGYGEDFDLNKVRYHKVIIMADADVDGAHIATLNLTLFFRYMRPMITAGYVYVAMPPLYRLKWTKGAHDFVYTDAERDRVLAEGKSAGRQLPKGEGIQRYKGLGEMSYQELWETTMDPDHRILKQVQIEDAAAADETFSMLMGDEVEPRRLFIQRNARNVSWIDA